jgi:hypothetical protein
LSTRARITASSFVNDYQWGDLKGDPRAWMERYFDAHPYLANWGTHRVALRLPIRLLDPDEVASYFAGESAHSWATRERVILDLSSEDEDGDEWCDGEGRLASIVPVRAELAAGDKRLLYLAWLLCVQGRELDEEEVEPLPAAGPRPGRRGGRGQREAPDEGTVGGGADQVGEEFARGGRGPANPVQGRDHPRPVTGVPGIDERHVAAVGHQHPRDMLGPDVMGTGCHLYHVDPHVTSRD